jgi:putative transposase
MGSVGDCYDNALCESFFATLECELLDRTSFRTPAEARPVVFQFIEGWYNPHRRHSAIDYLSPTGTKLFMLVPCNPQAPMCPLKRLLRNFRA